MSVCFMDWYKQWSLNFNLLFLSFCPAVSFLSYWKVIPLTDQMNIFGLYVHKQKFETISAFRKREVFSVVVVLGATKHWCLCGTGLPPFSSPCGNIFSQHCILSNHHQVIQNTMKSDSSEGAILQVSALQTLSIPFGQLVTGVKLQTFISPTYFHKGKIQIFCPQ